METVTAIRGKRREAISKGKTVICSHIIEWSLEGRGHRLSDTDVEHIQNSLIDNLVSGELCTITSNGNIANGWWSVQW